MARIGVETRYRVMLRVGIYLNLPYSACLLWHGSIRIGPRTFDSTVGSVGERWSRGYSGPDSRRSDSGEEGVDIPEFGGCGILCPVVLRGPRPRFQKGSLG